MMSSSQARIADPAPQESALRETFVRKTADSGAKLCRFLSFRCQRDLGSQRRDLKMWLVPSTLCDSTNSEELQNFGPGQIDLGGPATVTSSVHRAAPPRWTLTSPPIARCTCPKATSLHVAPVAACLHCAAEAHFGSYLQSLPGARSLGHAG
jgi:hypothetical protein